MEGYIIAGIILILLGQIALGILLWKQSARSSWRSLWQQDMQQNAKMQEESLREELRRQTDEQRKATAENFWRLEQRLDALAQKQAELQTKLLTEQKEEQQHLYEQLNRQTRDINETLAQSVGKLQDSNEKRLDQMREVVEEKLNKTLTERLDSSFQKVTEQLNSVYRHLGEMKTLAEDVNDLQRVLSNVKTRGTWAEVQLGNLLEQTLTENQFVRNPSIKNNRERVEFAVRIPSRDKEDEYILLPIDSKFPQEDYLRLSEAAERADKEAVEAAAKALERSIRKSAETIASLYIDVPNTTDFAILFLPTEGLYAEVLRRPGLAEEIQSKYHIMICGPTTITAFLNTLRVGFRTIALDRQANQVWKLLEATKSQYEQFGLQLSKAQRKIEEAGNAIGEAQHRSSIIQKKLKTVESLEPEGAEKLLGLADESEI